MHLLMSSAVEVGKIDVHRCLISAHFLVKFYGVTTLLNHINENNFDNFETFKSSLPVTISRSEWLSIGGQLMKTTTVNKLKSDIKSDTISNWNEVHHRYKEEGINYTKDLLEHAYCSLLEILNITTKQFNTELFKKLLEETVATKKWMTEGILKSREKDYTNPYRKMVYENNTEMNAVLGKLEDNSFIQEQFKGLEEFKINAEKINTNFTK